MNVTLPGNDAQKDYIIDTIDVLNYDEKKMIESIFRSKYDEIVQDKAAGTVVDLNLIDENTITQVFSYIKTIMDKKINQFKN